MTTYAEFITQVYECDFGIKDFSSITKSALGDLDGIVKGIMFYNIIDGKEELVYVNHRKKEIKRGELTINILKEIQKKERTQSELVKLVNNFNLINE